MRARGRSDPNCLTSSNFVVKGAQVEIHSDRLVTSKIDTNLVDFRKIKYKWTPNKAKQNRLYVNYLLLSIYVPVSRIKYALRGDAKLYSLFRQDKRSFWVLSLIRGILVLVQRDITAPDFPLYSI